MNAWIGKPSVKWYMVNVLGSMDQKVNCEYYVATAKLLLIKSKI